MFPGVFADHQPREILVTYDGATLLVAMAHSDHVSRTELTPGASVALAYPPLDVRPDELQMYQLAYVAALSLVPGALVGLLGHTGRAAAGVERRLGASRLPFCSRRPLACERGAHSTGPTSRKPPESQPWC